MKKMMLAACAMVFVLVPGSASRTPAGPKHYVVFQSSEPEGAAQSLQSAIFVAQTGKDECL